MNEANRRSEYRLAGNAIVFVETRAAGPAGEPPAAVVACEVIDLSANGLQVRMDHPLPVGSILRLGTDLGGQQPLYVVGEVRWVRSDETGHAIGFGLFDSDGTDIAAWKQCIAERLAR